MLYHSRADGRCTILAATVLTFEVAGEHILPERRHVSDAECGTGAGPHDDGRRLLLHGPNQTKWGLVVGDGGGAGELGAGGKREREQQ